MAFLVKDWEMFYTDAKSGDDHLVDQICIDKQNKKYLLYIEATDMVTDGYDETDEPINSIYVSRLVFDIIVSGIKGKGFTALVEE